MFPSTNSLAHGGTTTAQIHSAAAAGHCSLALAERQAARESANGLIQRRYAWRGYQGVSLPADPTADRMTLNATRGSEVVGTITVTLDSDAGLAADSTFPEAVARLRAEGHSLCEFGKLAVDESAGDKQLLATLFHAAFSLAHRQRGAGTLVMEVNPRHVRYYQRMAGARVVCEPRINEAVGAASVLLSVDLAAFAARAAGQDGDNARRLIYGQATPQAGTVDRAEEMLRTLAAPSMAIN